MPYTLAGTLKLPQTGQPAAGVILKFVALQSISPVLDRSESSIVTSATGAYSIQLEYNTYSVFATLYDNKPINCGQIVLSSTVATGLDLPTLLNGGLSEPLDPVLLVELQNLASAATSAAQSAASSATSAAASAAEASQISVISTVEGAIAEHNASANAHPVPSVSITPTGNNATLDLANASVFRVTLNAHITQIVLTNASGKEGSTRHVTLILRQGTGVNLATWPENIRWAYGHLPVLSYEKDAEDYITLVRFGADAHWYGFLTGGWFHV